MTRTTWKKKIKECMEKAGTYRDCFEPVMDTLADILEKRDNTQELYEKSGANPVVKHTNKGGATNIEKNPLLVVVNDLNRDALAYWKELGLTPSGLKKINEEGLKKKNVGFGEMLNDLMKDG